VKARWWIMKTAARFTIYFSTMVIIFIFFTACSGAGNIGEAPPKAVCGSLVNAKCTRCHYKTRICDALGTKSVRKWKQSITFMLKQGAQLTEDEQNKIVACLSTLPEGSEVVCD
jgi:hypothetical protein